MDKMDTMFESDPVVSHLYSESFRRTRMLEPERELMLAILTDAIECLQKYCGSRQATATRLFQEARDWIFDENEQDAFSFLNVCQALELDPCYIRRGIANLMVPLSAAETVVKTPKPLTFKQNKRNPKTRGKWSLRPAVHGYRASRAR
jgi:hypothetical protein